MELLKIDCQWTGFALWMFRKVTMVMLYYSRKSKVYDAERARCSRNSLFATKIVYSENVNDFEAVGKMQSAEFWEVTAPQNTS